MADERSATEREHELELAGALRRICPPSVVSGVRRIDGRDEALLHPAEAVHVAAAVPARRREFATGRALLRQVIGADVVMPMGADRRPVLPEGVRATLAHDDTWAVAAATRDGAIRALGIDIEPDERLDAELAEIILRSDDRHLAGIALDARLAFTLKEAAYKAWSAAGGRVLDHHDLRLTASPTTFGAHDATGVLVAGGMHTAAAGRLLALAVLRVD